MFLEKEWELEPTFSAAATVMAYLTYKIDLDNGNVPINRAKMANQKICFNILEYLE